jgi:hypothetical protein
MFLSSSLTQQDAQIQFLHFLIRLFSYSSEYPAIREIVPLDAIPQVKHALCSGNHELISKSIEFLDQLSSFNDVYKRLIFSADLVSPLLMTYSPHAPHILVMILQQFPKLLPCIQPEDLTEIWKLILLSLSHVPAATFLFESLLKTPELSPHMTKALIEANVVPTIIKLASRDPKKSTRTNGLVSCLYAVFVENIFDVPIDCCVISGMMSLWNLPEETFYDRTMGILALCLADILLHCPSDDLISESGVVQMLLDHQLKGLKLRLSASCVMRIIRKTLSNSGSNQLPQFFVESELFSFFIFVLTEQPSFHWQFMTKGRLPLEDDEGWLIPRMDQVPLGQVINLIQRIMRSDPKYVQEIREMLLPKELKEILLTGFEIPKAKKSAPNAVKPSPKKRSRETETSASPGHLNAAAPTRKSPRTRKPRQERD